MKFKLLKLLSTVFIQKDFLRIFFSSSNLWCRIDLIQFLSLFSSFTGFENQDAFALKLRTEIAVSDLDSLIFCLEFVVKVVNLLVTGFN